GRHRGLLHDPLVMIVYRHRQSLFGVVLPDAMQIKLALYFRRLGNRHARFVLSQLRCQFLIQDLLAKHDTVVADIDARTGDEFLDLRVRLAAKTAQRDIRRPRHRVYSFLSAKLVAFSASPGISLRDCTTSSTSP